jgi:hypothetical protein
MRDFKKTFEYLKTYSKEIDLILPSTLVRKGHSDKIKAISFVLYLNPIPIQVKKLNISPTLFTEPVTHIPLHVNKYYSFRTKMIIWNPLAYIDEHSHGNEDCFFQPIFPGMIQTLYQDDFPITTFTKTNEFNFINDSIGTHSITNTLHSRTNVSFHLYIENQDRV